LSLPAANERWHHILNADGFADAVKVSEAEITHMRRLKNIIENVFFIAMNHVEIRCGGGIDVNTGIQKSSN
jgi:hypothetical protein